MKKLIALFCALLLLAPPAWAAPNATFTPDTTTVFRNPERGWHFQSGSLDSCAANDFPNWAADAAGLPTPIDTPSIVRLQTSLGTGVPSGATMSAWNTCFATMRSLGIMGIINFLSTGNAAQEIAQAQAIRANGVLSNNRDVIVSVWVGFRCDFGEWASTCTDNNDVTDKTNVFNAVVAMTPSSIPLEFTQIYERETWFGNKIPPTKDQFKAGTLIGRLGFFSACFGTGQGDSSFYTFVATAASGQLTGFASTMTAAQQAAYVQQASNYTSFAVETCNNSAGASVEMRTACTGGADAQGLPGGILNEGPRYHVVTINGAYAPNYLAAWSSGGCLTTVANRMGYRFQFDDITHPTTVARGAVATFDVNMRNVGWARIYSQRRLHVNLVNGGTTIDCVSSTQLRELDPQATTSSLVRVNCAIPAGAPTGSYAVSVKLPSAFSTTQTGPFTIRPANTGWDAANFRLPSGTSVTVT